MVSGTRVPQGTRLNPRRTFEVCEGMSIQVAINAASAQVPAPSAANPWTVLIYPGIYDEAITCASWVNLRGVGPKGSVVIYQDDANIITLATQVQLQNFTVRLGTPTAQRRMIDDNSVAVTARMSDLVLECVNPGAQAFIVFTLLGAGDYTIERCSYNIGGAGGTAGVYNSGNAATIHLVDNDFTFINVNAFHIGSLIAGTWTGGGNRWAGTCRMFNANNGTITLDNEAVVCTGMAAGDVTGGTITLRTGLNSYEVFPGMIIAHAVGAGRYIFLHPGTFRLTAALNIAVNNVTIQGSGRQSILTTDTADLDIVTAAAVAGLVLRDFQIDGNLGGVACDMGIYLNNVDESKIIDVYVQDCGEDCIMLEDCDHTEVQHSYGDNSTEHGLYLLSCIRCKVIGGYYNNNTLDGIHIRGDATGNADYNTLESVDCTGNGSDGVEISEAGPGQANKNTILGCQLIGNTGINLNDGGTNTEVGHNITV